MIFAYNFVVNIDSWHLCLLLGRFYYFNLSFMLQLKCITLLAHPSLSLSPSFRSSSINCCSFSVDLSSFILMPWGNNESNTKPHFILCFFSGGHHYNALLQFHIQDNRENFSFCFRIFFLRQLHNGWSPTWWGAYAHVNIPPHIISFPVFYVLFFFAF